MENKKNGLTLFFVIIIAVLSLSVGVLLGNKNYTAKDEKENNQEVVHEVETNNEDTDNKSVCEVGTIKNIIDVISDNDTNAQKAQIIAKELMDAVNNKDWYYLAKMVGKDADYFIKYDIHDYSIDINDYIDNEGTTFVFTSKYDWDKTKLNSLEDVSLGTLLVIEFEDGGKINIYPNCTGA